MKFSADYRALALDALRGRWKTAVLAGLVASVLGANIVSSSDRVISNMSQNANGDTPGFAGLFSTGSGGVLAVLVICILAWAVFTVIVGGAVRLGYARFNLNLADGRDAALSDLASQKHRLWDGFCMNFLQGLYVALWSLLLFIPGVVKAYSYAMTPYIMAEHPGLTANEAITESRRIMDGNKWRLFCLHLSFIGWGIQLSGLGAALHPAHADWFLSRLCLHPLGGYGPRSADPAVHPAERRLFLSAPLRGSGLGDLLPGYHRCTF